MNKKHVVDALEFRGGYALVPAEAIEAVIAGYRSGLINKDGLRVFAAKLEKSALHAKSKVDLSRILNSKASLEGIKRLRLGVIQRVGESLDLLLKASQQGKQRRNKCIPRRVLRAIAQGKLSCSESVVLLMYFLKRITQVKALKRLEEGERYARFTYGDLEELSGMPRANISRAVGLLKSKGFLSTVWVVKPNENQFGLLFVDGAALTLIKGAPADREKAPVNKTTTPPAQNNNTPVIVLPTLIKSYPKREILKERAVGSFDKFNNWERIQQRGKQIRETLDAQAA